MVLPSETIAARARSVVDGVLADEIGFSRMVKQMVTHTIKEYRGRFLHELIQNGYDAHPEGSAGGRLAIHFELDPAHSGLGVLYVANGGSPLSASNFERMASLGESDKPIGVGIGNKGVGFKSVFQICDVPEVYSALDEHDPGFNGFSFRFGMHADLVRMLSNSSSPSNPGSTDNAAVTEQRARQVAENLSLSTIDTANGKVQFLQAVGLTSDEYGAAVAWNTTKLLELFTDRLRPLVTDIERDSLLCDPGLRKTIAEGIERNGSSRSLLRVAHLAGGVTLQFSEYVADEIARTLRSRLLYDNTHPVSSPARSILFRPAKDVLRHPGRPPRQDRPSHPCPRNVSEAMRSPGRTEASPARPGLVIETI